MASMLDPYTANDPAPWSQNGGIPSIPGLEDASATATNPILARHAELTNTLQNQALENEQRQMNFQSAAEQRLAAGHMQSLANDPAYAGKGWNELAPEQRQQIQNGYRFIGAQIPQMFNAAQSEATGRPIGVNVQEGEQVSGEVPGGFKFTQIQPNAQQSMGENGETLPSGHEAMIQGFVNRQLPISALPRGPQKQMILQQIMARDPSFSPQLYDAQNKARESFVGQGKNGQAVLSANTVLHHLGTAFDAIDAMQNSGAPGWNAIANKVGGLVGTPAHSAVAAYETSADTAATELAKLLSGGIPNEGEIKRFHALLSSNENPQTLKRNIQQMALIVGGRLGELDNEWKNSVGKNRDLPFLTQDTANRLRQFGMDPSLIEQNAPQGQPQPTTQQPKLSPQDQTAIQWANANPTDPRAARIRQLHGIQ